MEGGSKSFRFFSLFIMGWEEQVSNVPALNTALLLELWLCSLKHVRLNSNRALYYISA